jgi:hypothetical protein
MKENDYLVQVEDVQDLVSVKRRYQVPSELQSCHTAIVDGYVIEGHVPVEDVERLLSERPDIIGLAVPGMPVGSPGMEVAGVDPQPFDVLSFDSTGTVEVFSSHPN